MCEYSRNNQHSYADAFSNQLRITIPILLVDETPWLFYFRSVKLH